MMRCQAENCHQTITVARAVHIDATLTTMAQPGGGDTPT